MPHYKTAIIGPQNVISGFKALGAIPHKAETPQEAYQTMQILSKKGEEFAVVIIMESLIKNMPIEEYMHITRGPLPAFVVLPGIEGSMGTGIAKLKKLTEKAVGSNILG